VSRLAGVDRFGTAAAISAATFSTKVPVAYVATGLDFPDALAGAAAAGGRGPLLLVTSAQVPNVMAGELRRLTAASTTVFGGTSSVGDATARLADAITAGGIPAPSPSAAKAVAVAHAQLGKPYAWGGAGPDTFDCSGLTAFAWRPEGANLPHNAAAQDDLVASIPLSALAPGDLVFYGSPVTHEGIYIGNGQMIEAAHTGAPVRIAAIDRPDLAGAGRPLPTASPPTSGTTSTTVPGPPAGGPTTTTP
jgi:cell wall-associated NlpC family hydrolase